MAGLFFYSERIIKELIGLYVATVVFRSMCQILTGTVSATDRQMPFCGENAIKIAVQQMYGLYAMERQY